MQQDLWFFEREWSAMRQGVRATRSSGGLHRSSRSRGRRATRRRKSSQSPSLKEKVPVVAAVARTRSRALSWEKSLGGSGPSGSYGQSGRQLLLRKGLEGARIVKLLKATEELVGAANG